MIDSLVILCHCFNWEGIWLWLG